MASSGKEFQLVRYTVGKQTFEVLTKPGAAVKFRKGLLGWDNVLFHDEVFKSFSKAEKAKASELKEALGTDSVVDAAKAIVEKGDIQFSAAERKEFVERKKAEIVNYIHKYYIDPKTKTPHPVARIENALDQLKVRVDPDVPVEKQVQDICKRLPEVLTIKRQEVEGTLTVPNKHMGVAAGVIQKYVTVRSERYTEDGCVMHVTMVPGDYNALIADMNKVTKGEFNFEIEGAQMAATSEDDDQKKKKGGGGRKK